MFLGTVFVVGYCCSTFVIRCSDYQDCRACHCRSCRCHVCCSDFTYILLDLRCSLPQSAWMRRLVRSGYGAAWVRCFRFTLRSDAARYVARGALFGACTVCRLFITLDSAFVQRYYITVPGFYGSTLFSVLDIYVRSLPFNVTFNVARWCHGFWWMPFYRYYVWWRLRFTFCAWFLHVTVCGFVLPRCRSACAYALPVLLICFWFGLRSGGFTHRVHCSWLLLVAVYVPWTGFTVPCCVTAGLRGFYCRCSFLRSSVVPCCVLRSLRLLRIRFCCRLVLVACGLFYRSVCPRLLLGCVLRLDSAFAVVHLCRSWFCCCHTFPLRVLCVTVAVYVDYTLFVVHCPTFAYNMVSRFTFCSLLRTGLVVGSSAYHFAGLPCPGCPAVSPPVYHMVTLVADSTYRYLVVTPTFTVSFVLLSFWLDYLSAYCCGLSMGSCACYRLFAPFRYLPFCSASRGRCLPVCLSFYAYVCSRGLPVADSVHTRLGYALVRSPLIRYSPVTLIPAGLRCVTRLRYVAVHATGFWFSGSFSSGQVVLFFVSFLFVLVRILPLLVCSVLCHSYLPTFAGSGFILVFLLRTMPVLRLRVRCCLRVLCRCCLQFCSSRSARGSVWFTVLWFVYGFWLLLLRAWFLLRLPLPSLPRGCRCGLRSTPLHATAVAFRSARLGYRFRLAVRSARLPR